MLSIEFCLENVFSVWPTQLWLCSGYELHSRNFGLSRITRNRILHVHKTIRRLRFDWKLPSRTLRHVRQMHLNLETLQSPYSQSFQLSSRPRKHRRSYPSSLHGANHGSFWDYASYSVNDQIHGLFHRVWLELLLQIADSILPRNLGLNFAALRRIWCCRGC